MLSKTLASSHHSASIVNLEAESSIPVEIEVPKGEWQYFLRHEAGESHYVFHLRHPDSQIKVSGIVEARGETEPLLTTTVIHHSPQTKAQTLIRTLAYDKAAPRYFGKIEITPGAQGSESYLNHHSLLLGGQSRSFTEPSLEIKANQVKCSHAATIRSLTELDLFYLRSRGLDKEGSRELLVQAFLADVITSTS